MDRERLQVAFDLYTAPHLGSLSPSQLPLTRLRSLVLPSVCVKIEPDEQKGSILIFIGKQAGNLFNKLL
jgi:hypothetical protein